MARNRRRFPGFDDWRSIPHSRPFPTQSTLFPIVAAMQAFVYKSQRKPDTYLYLSARDDFGRVPEALRTQLGGLQFVLEVALTPERNLATEDVAVVRENLVMRGFHLQFPPANERDPMADDWGTDA